MAAVVSGPHNPKYMTCWADPEWQGALPQLYAQHISHKCDLEGDNAHTAKERVGDGASESMGIHPTVLVHCRHHGANTSFERDCAFTGNGLAAVSTP